MEKILSEEVKRGLLYIDHLDSLERKNFLKSVTNTATKDFACKWIYLRNCNCQEDLLTPLFPVIDVPDCPTVELVSLQTSLLTLYTIATKHNTSLEEISRFLREGLKLQDESIAEIIDNFSQCRDEIHSKLSKYDHDIPWVTNVNWKLSSVLRSSGNEELNADLVYKVSFEGVSQPGRRVVLTSFECTLEELQNLSSKFKEIERNCHRLAHGITK